MTEKPGIAGKRKACGWDEKTRDKVIGIKTSEKEGMIMYKLLSVCPVYILQ